VAFERNFFERMLHIKPTVLLNDKNFGLFVAKFEATNDPKNELFLLCVKSCTYKLCLF